MGGTVSRPKPNVPGGEHLDGDLAEEEEEEEEDVFLSAQKEVEEEEEEEETTTTTTTTTSEMRGESDVSVGKVYKNPSLLEKKRKRRRSPTTEEETTTKKRPVKKSKMIEVAKFNTRKSTETKKERAHTPHVSTGLYMPSSAAAQKLEQELKRLDAVQVATRLDFFSQTSPNYPRTRKSERNKRRMLRSRSAKGEDVLERA